MKKVDGSMQMLTADYLLCCESEGKSRRTLRWYEQKLTYFRAFLKEECQVRQIDEVGPQEIRRFIHHLQNDVKAGENNPRRPTMEQGISPQTVAGYARTLRAFFSWAVREGYVDESPMRLVRTPKVPHKAMPHFTEEEVGALLAELKKPTPAGRRNHAMVLLLLDTGLRVSELVHLKMADLHLEQGLFKVMGKGAKERIVPMGQSSRRALLDYVRKHRPEPALPAIDEVFLTQGGYPMKPDYVYKILAGACRQVGISGKRLGPHTCRHTFARSFLMNGGDLLTLQRILGHASLEVVRMYVNLDANDLLAQQRKYSPMDALQVPRTKAD